RAKSPTVSRALVAGCDNAANSSPCFDVGSAYSAYGTNASWTANSATFTLPNGIAAGSRPFVPGMSLFCTGCAANLVAVDVSHPPTESTGVGEGQVGHSFTVTASATISATAGSANLVGGCSGTPGVGSNCLDIAFDINTVGTYVTPAALTTCGVNNMVG